MSELTKQQIKRQDFVDNYIFKMVNDLVPERYRHCDPQSKLYFKFSGEAGAVQLDWDIEWISEIREVVQTIIADKMLSALRSNSDEFEMEFYPYLKESELCQK